MKGRWHELSAKFAALQKREKLLTVGATVFAIVMGGYSLWVEPAKLRAAALTKQIAKDRAELRDLQTQLATLKSQIKDPDAPSKAALAEIKSRMAVAESNLHGYDNVLVVPQRMPQLLQSLLARHRGLELVSLKTLQPELLLKPPPKTDAKADGKPAPDMRENNLHKHGIQIKVAGNYLDLLAYVDELEKLPQKLLWGEMSLAVTGYPRSELALTVYTLSLESIWLVV